MAAADEIFATIEAIHAAGLDATQWPRALAAVSRTVGGIAATIEIFDTRTRHLNEFHSFGIPSAGELAYLADSARNNPRQRVLFGLKPGSLCWDYMAIDESRMNRDPFYAEFLASTGFRYFIGGALEATEKDFSLFSVQRAAKQGHIDEFHQSVMRRLLPHVQQAVDVARRLRGTEDARHTFEGALDWLTDGVALVRANGTLAYTNEAFQAIARRGEGIRIRKNEIDFSDSTVRARFDEAIGNVRKLLGRETRANGSADFHARRPSGSSYLIAVRPLMERRQDGSGVAIVFVHDSSSVGAATSRMLCTVFGFTAAEATLALALQAGMSPTDYALGREVSLNTVYTHLRRLKEKTGCNRMPELIRKLNALQMSWRPD